MVLLRIVSVAVALVTVVLFLRPALSDYFLPKAPDMSKNAVSLALAITGEDARYHYLRGLLTYSADDGGGLDKALRNYLLSLERNPTDSRTWLALARAYRETRMPDKAGYAVKKAVFLDRNNPTVKWEAGVFFLLEGSTDEAIRSFRRYISMVPADQENVYSLCYSMGVKPMYLLENLVPAEYPFYRSYLAFLASNKLLDESRLTWGKMKAMDPQRKDYLGYIDFLIGSADITEAVKEWDEFLKRFKVLEKARPAGDLLWNGHFDLPPENGGFDWRIGEAEGARVFRDKDVIRSGDTSLSINFDGQSNSGIVIAQQIVPVKPRKLYRLSGFLKTDRLTTRNGIILGVSGLLCDPIARKTEPVSGTTMWKKTDLEFTTPSTCKTVVVFVAREKSEKFDSKISGDAWIDSLSLTEVREK